MAKKLIILLGSLLLSTGVFSTTWEYEGGLDGESGLMIVYKTLPPLIVEVDEPELMTVPKGTKSFKYSEVVRSKKPLNVKIEIYFNNSVVEDNGINKEIIRTIYDTAKLSFVEQGEFKLIKEDSGVGPRESNVDDTDVESIDGEVFFTNSIGVVKAQGNGKELISQIGDTISSGTLHKSDIYIDAQFNKKEKELLSGQYSGKTTLVVEFIGKEVGSR